MFDKLRRKSHSHMARRELGQSLEHFMLAASHAAKGTGATVTPKVNAARMRVQPAAGRVRNVATTGWGSTIAALAPLAAAATKNAQESRKMKEKNVKALERRAKAMRKREDSRKSSKLTGLLVAGAAVGAAGALILRRRKQQTWDEYAPGGSTSTAKPLDADEMLPASLADEGTTTSQGTAQTMTDTAPGITASEKDQTSSSMHSPTVARMAGGNSPS